MNRLVAEPILKCECTHSRLLYASRHSGLTLWTERKREQRGSFQFNKVISHPDSVDTSIYKTDSLSIGYRLQLIAFKLESLQAEINATRRIKAVWGWWNSQRTDTRITANSKDRNNCFDLTKLHKLDPLHNDRVTCCCCCKTGLLTEASGFLFAQIGLEWFNEPILCRSRYETACGDSKQNTIRKKNNLSYSQLVPWDPCFRVELHEEESRQHQSLVPHYKCITSSHWIMGIMDTDCLYCL